jgi:hypothetical protein
MKPFRYLCGLWSAVFLLVLVGSGRAAVPEKYLPDDSDLVVALNVKQYLTAPVVRRHLPAFLKEVGKEKDLARLVMVIKDNLSSLVVATKMQQSDTRLFAVGQGEWDPARFETSVKEAAKALEGSAKATEAAGAKVYELRPKGAKPDAAPLYLTSPEKGVVVITSSKDYLSEALAKGQGKRKTQLKKEVKKLLGRIDTQATGGVAWRDTMHGYTGVGSLKVAEDIEGDLVITAKDPTEAKKLSNTFSIVLEALKKSQGLPSIVPPIAEGIQLAREGNEVILKVRVKGKAIDDALKPR